MTENKELELAWNFIEYTNRSIFLTGKAGTGKTTFLKKVTNESLKQKVVVAPTGVAAINAGGVTIHSFFQLPFGPITPESILSGNDKRFEQKINRQKINIIKSLDLLIIDEISMVRADLLDGIDQVLRKYKNRNEVFGGVQVLMIGDLQQLSPVVKQDEWEILKKHYNTPYFFSSKAFMQANALKIELKQIYRQKNQDFIEILNQIRNNKITDESLKKLNSRYIPDFKPNEPGYIMLTTHNNKADKINNEQMEMLKTKAVSFKANITGNFPENIYPLPENLTLKKDAQVMFVKNDSSLEKRYFNGEIGIIHDISDKYVVVYCKDTDEYIEVSKETWDNTTYTINNKTKEIEEKILGSFSQIPLRPAWAITIHKSQGLTFDKAIIDTNMAFSHGQTYVALSRCTSLDGLVLSSPISRSSIILDRNVFNFVSKINNERLNENELKQSKTEYQLSLINEIFDLSNIVFPLHKLSKSANQAKNNLKSNIQEVLPELNNNTKNIIDVAKKFKQQLYNIHIKNNLELSDDKQIQERFCKAVMYFIKYIKQNIENQLNKIEFITDNTQIKKEIEKSIDEINLILKQKLFVLSNLTEGFNQTKYLKLRLEASHMSVSSKKQSTADKITINQTSHPALFNKILQWRRIVADDENVPAFNVFHNSTIFDICDKLPLNSVQLKKVKGFGKVRIKKYGDEIIKIVEDYCNENNISPTPQPEEKPKKPKIDTKKLSYEMFLDGMDIIEIAKQRELKPQTIEVHLGHYVNIGKLDIYDVIPEEKVNRIMTVIKNNPESNLKEFKDLAGEDVSFSQVRIVLEYMENEKENKNNSD